MTRNIIRPAALAILLGLAGCVGHPDPTTMAIASADASGGVCTTQTAPLFDANGGVVENFNCEDHAMAQISSLVYSDDQE